MEGGIKLKFEVIDKLFKPNTSTGVLLKSFSIFVPNRKKIRRIFTVIVVAVIPAIIISLQEETVTMFSDVSDIVINLMLALFGIVFTGYTIYQAILNEKMLIKMVEKTAKTKDGEESLLQNINTSFVSLMMLIIVSIAGSFFLKITIGNLPSDFALFEMQRLNEFLSILLITVYLGYAFTILYEIKCFVFNIAQLFNVYSGARILEIIERYQSMKK